MSSIVLAWYWFRSKRHQYLRRKSRILIIKAENRAVRSEFVPHRFCVLSLETVECRLRPVLKLPPQPARLDKLIFGCGAPMEKLTDFCPRFDVGHAFEKRSNRRWLLLLGH